MQATEGAAQVVPKFWRTPYGVINAVPEDNVVTESLARHGRWVESELDFLGELLPEGATVVEVGGEYGAHALCLSRVVGATGEVHVLEQDRLLHLQTCANIALNGVVNVYAHLPAKGRRAYSSLRDLDLTALHCIKVNPTGVLDGLLAEVKDLVRQHKPYLYFRLGSPHAAREEIRAVKALGYRCWSHIAYLHAAADPAAAPDAVAFPGWAHQNVIAAPQESGLDADFSHLREI
ncbi:hypothetical protein JHW38_02985 [Lysobacter enzymogenes]|nr:hypothetical protein [Lysobacter enzymogenes]QQP97037.1 hypothetical protein JHW38_02985 [Lysobacter enzymogenes]